MKNVLCRVLGAFVTTAILIPQLISAQGTAFTYQGRLNDNGSPASGLYDLQFTVYDSTNLPGTLIAGPLTNSATMVSNGLFTVALDFGPGVFIGADRWLEIAVRTNGAVSFSTLGTRQHMSPTPYAISASNLGGVLRVDSNNTNGAPNLIGGAPLNFVAAGVAGATIAGGGATNYQGSRQTNSISGDFGTISGGLNNTILSNAAFSAIGGGFANKIQTNAGSSTISGGYNNLAQPYANASTIGGGAFNTASGPNGVTIGGGEINTASSSFSTVGGGDDNTASGFTSTVSGGELNTASGNYATVSGGDLNTASGHYAAIAGGHNNAVAGDYSFAAGQNCTINHDGCFMWSDGTLPFGTLAANSFNALATGGYFLYTGSGVGVQLAGGGNAWSALSDRNMKENFEPVDCKKILDKVAAIPMTTWNLKTQPPQIRHIGAMAQDFKAAFQVGEDDRHISTSDADGVALAAIQGLNEKVETGSRNAQDRIQKLEMDNAELKARLGKLERLLSGR